jgi:hypothetical protein
VSLACAARVDPNPIRAGFAQTIEDRQFTPARLRLQTIADAGQDAAGAGEATGATGGKNNHVFERPNLSATGSALKRSGGRVLTHWDGSYCAVNANRRAWIPRICKVSTLAATLQWEPLMTHCASIRIDEWTRPSCSGGSIQGEDRKMMRQKDRLAETVSALRGPKNASGKSLSATLATAILRRRHGWRCLTAGCKQNFHWGLSIGSTTRTATRPCSPAQRG